jgi:hypothetical protein
MRIWRKKKLVEELARDALSEREKVTYFVFTAVMWTTAALIRNPKPWTIFDNIRLLAIAITILGYVMCFRVNKTSDGRCFVERAVISSVPLTFRTFVAAFCVHILARAVFPDLVKSPVFSPVFANLITGYFFWRLWKNFCLLSDLIRQRPALYPKQLGKESAG